MSNRFTRILALAALLAAGATQAQQPVVRGEPALTSAPAAAAQLRLPAGVSKARAALPPVTPAELATIRQANQADSTKLRERRIAIGVVREAAPAVLATASTLNWVPVPGGHAAQFAVTSPEAASMRLSIDLAGVPADVEMVFFGSADASRLEGPVRVAEIADRTSPWWSPITEGATQTVEFFVPSRHDAAKLALRVVRASHLFAGPSTRFSKQVADIGTSGSCNVDILCSPLNADANFRNTAASVAQMVFNDSNLLILCSGTLLADTDPLTQTPWFYSANHCFDNNDPPFKTASQMQQVAGTLSTLWDFQASSCNSQAPSSSWRQLYGGSTYIYNEPESDVLLVRLNNPPPAGAFFSGWDANTISSGTSVISIHHPEGDLKKVSQGTTQGFDAPGVAGGNRSFIEVLWSTGTTEPGSSGGGLWSKTGGQYFLRGGLWGGTALCTNRFGTDNFSRFDQAYPQLAAYLGAAASPAFDYTDLWWNPSESGWGLSLVQHPNKILFGVWYTYEQDGTRTWYVMPTGSWSSPTHYSGPLYVTNGPSFEKAFDASQVQTRQVGTLNIDFSSQDTGTFTYLVDGVSGTKSMQRQPF